MEDEAREAFVEVHGERALEQCGSSLASVNEKADVYSFGVIIFELEFRQPPYRELNPHAVPFAVVRGQRPIDYIFLNNEMERREVSIRSDPYQ